MADTSIAVQPASNLPAAAPVQFELGTMVNSQGQTTLIQAVTLVDEFGRPVVPMSEETGQNILLAIKALHATMAASTGDLLPSTRGLSPT